jgi:hypothetical protein
VAGYDEARAVLEALWAEELAALERTEAEAERRIREAHQRVEGLQADISGGAAEIGQLHAELDAMPALLGQAQLAGDDAEVVALQGRHAEIHERIASIEARMEEAREALISLTGGNPAAYLRRVEAQNSTIQHRSDFKRKVAREFAALREDLEEALERAMGERRPVRERIREEEQAALRYQSGVETRAMLGLETPKKSGIRVLSPGR